VAIQEYVIKKSY